MERQKLLDIALSDLNSSIALFESSNYPQSVFHMQQSVEKLGKFLAISLGVYHINDFKKIGHNALKIYKSALNYYIQLINTLSDKYKIENIDLSPIEEQFKTISDLDLLNLDAEYLDMMLESLAEADSPQMLFDTNQEKSDLLDQFFQLTVDLNEIAEDERKQVLNLYHSNKLFQTIIDEKLEGFLNTFPGYVSASQSAFILAVVFTRHTESTRYVLENSDPISKYTINNPLVSRLPNFQNYLETSINRCIDFVKYSH